MEWRNNSSSEGPLFNVDFDSDLPTSGQALTKTLLLKFKKNLGKKVTLKKMWRKSHPSGKEMRLAMATVNRGFISRGFDNYVLLDEMDRAIEDDLLKSVS